MAALSLQRSKTALGAAFRRKARHKGGAVAVFDTDASASRLKDFRRWDVKTPVYVSSEFDLVVCAAQEDLDQLFHALRVVCHFDFTRPVLLVQPEERALVALDHLEQFGMRVRATRNVKGRKVAYLSNFDLPIF